MIVELNKNEFSNVLPLVNELENPIPLISSKYYITPPYFTIYIIMHTIRSLFQIQGFYTFLLLYLPHRH